MLPYPFRPQHPPIELVMKKIFLRQPPQRNKGFTLMEVLIAMAIGLVVLVGALSYFGRGVRALQTGDAYARMHEAGSRAGSIISRDIQLAGFYGYGGSSNEASIVPSTGYDYGSSTIFLPAHPSIKDSSGNLMLTFATQCGASNLVALSRPVEHYTSVTNATNTTSGGAIPATCFPDASTGTQVLVVRGALEGESTVILTGGDREPYGPNQILVAASPFSGGNVPAVSYFFGNPATGTAYPPYSLARAVQAGLIPKRQSGAYVPIFPYSFRTYYVQDCRLASNANCADNEPTLVRHQTTQGSGGVNLNLQVVRMIPGIQKIAYFWGMDDRGGPKDHNDEDTGDGVTDYWLQSLPSADFNKVNAVRIQILVRATAPDPTYNDAENTYYFDDGAAGFNCGSSEDCRHRRTIYETATSVRNCSLRRRAGTLSSGDC